jgi:hypothetical protein
MKQMKNGLLVVMAVLALALAAACGGGGDDGNAPAGGQTEQKNGATSQPRALVMEPNAVLGASAEAFKTDIQSVSGDMTFDIKMAGSSFGADGDFAVQGPDKMHLTIKLRGDGMTGGLGDLGQFEVLLLGDQVYMNTALTGWVAVSLDQLGADSEGIKKLLDDHAPFDYQHLVDQLGGDVQHLGTATIDGVPFERYRVTTSLSDVLDSLSKSFGDSSAFGSSELKDALSGPMTFDVWVDPDTLLPRRVEAVGAFGQGAQSAAFTLRMNLTQYNGAVNIPAPPADAKDFSQITGGLDKLPGY